MNLNEHFVLATIIAAVVPYIEPVYGTDTLCEDCPPFRGFLTCDTLTCDWLLSNGYWVSNVTEGSDLLMGNCPFEYCAVNESDQFVRIPHEATQKVGEFLCNGSHRMGVVCGECQPGYGPSINSDSNLCVPCDSRSSNINWFYYILAIYVPLVIVFLVIIVFNIRLTTGPLNSFILFAQVISSTNDISQQGVAPLNVVYGSGTSAFRASYKIPYDFFNLNLIGNLIPPFCLHKDMDTLGVIALRYVVALFPLVIILTIVVVVRFHGRYGWRCITALNTKISSCLGEYRAGATMVEAFAVFVLLSYNRLCQITAALLAFNSLFDYTLKTKDVRIYYQSTYSFNDPRYNVAYKLPAFSMLVILIIVPITLLHYPVKWFELLVSKVKGLKSVYPTASIAILLDTFQGCFKDNRRYFAGLYLALRLLLFFASVTPQLLLEYLFQQVLFVAYLVMIAVLKPYKDKRLNYLDAIIFANLALINALTWYTINPTGYDLRTLQLSIVLESILVYLPMVYFMLCLLWFLSGRYSRHFCRGRVAKCCDGMRKALQQKIRHEKNITVIYANKTPVNEIPDNSGTLYGSVHIVHSNLLDLS